MHSEYEIDNSQTSLSCLTRPSVEESFSLEIGLGSENVSSSVCPIHDIKILPSTMVPNSAFDLN